MEMLSKSSATIAEKDNLASQLEDLKKDKESRIDTYESEIEKLRRENEQLKSDTRASETQKVETAEVKSQLQRQSTLFASEKE